MFSKLWFVGSLFVACIEGYGYGGGGGQHSIGGPVVVKVGAPGFSLSGSIKDDPAEKEAEYDAYLDGPAGTGFGFTDELGKLLDKFKGGLKIEKNPDGTPSIKLEGSLNLPGNHHGVHDHYGPHGHYSHHGYHGHHGHHGPYGHHPPYDFYGGYDHFPPHGHHGHPPPGVFAPDSPYGSLFGFPFPFHPHGPHPQGNIEDHINKKPSDVENYKPSSNHHDCEGKCPPEIDPHHHIHNQENAEHQKHPYPPNYDTVPLKPHRPPHRKNPGRKPVEWSGMRPEEKPTTNQNVPNIESSPLCDSYSGNLGSIGCNFERKPSKPTGSEESEQFPIENGSSLDSTLNPLGALGRPEPESIDKPAQNPLAFDNPLNKQPSEAVDILNFQVKLNPSRPQNPKPGEYSENQPEIRKPSVDKPISYMKPNNNANEQYSPNYEKDKLSSELTGQKPDAPTNAQSPGKPQSQHGNHYNVHKDPYHKENQYETYLGLSEYPTIPSKDPYVFKNPAQRKPSDIYPTYEVPKYQKEHQPESLTREYDDHIYYPGEQPAVKPSYKPTIQRPQKVTPTQSSYTPEEAPQPGKNPHKLQIPIPNKPYPQQISIPHTIMSTVKDQLYPEYTDEQKEESHIPVHSISKPISHASKPQHSGEFKPYEPTSDLHSNTAVKPYPSNSPITCGSACDTKPNLSIDSSVAVVSFGEENGNAPEDNPIKGSDFLEFDTLDSATYKPSVDHLLPQLHKPYHEDTLNHKPHHDDTPNSKPISPSGGYQPKPDQNNLAPPKRSYSSNSNAGKLPNQLETGRPNAGLDNVIPKAIRTTLRPPTLPTLDQIKEPSVSEDMLESSTEKSLAQLAKEICGPHCWVPSHPDPKPEEIADGYREDYGEYLDYADGGTEYDDSEPIENGEFGGLVVASTTEKLGLDPKAAPEKMPSSSVDKFPVKSEPLKPKNPSASSPSSGYGQKYEDRLKPASPNRSMPGNQNKRWNQDLNLSPDPPKPETLPVGYALNNRDKFSSQKQRMNPMVESEPYKPDNESRQGLPSPVGGTSNGNLEGGLAYGITPGLQTTSQPETLKSQPTRNNPFEPQPDVPVEPELVSAMPNSSGSEEGSPLDCGGNCDESTVVESSSISAIPKEDDNDSSEVYDDDGNTDGENNNSENNDGETNNDENTSGQNNDDENNGGEKSDGENGKDVTENSETEEQTISSASQNAQPESLPQLNQQPPINTTPKKYPYQSNPTAIVSELNPECGSHCDPDQQTQLPSPASSVIYDEVNKPAPQISLPSPSLDREQPKKPFPFHPCHGHRKGHHRGHRRCIERHRIQGHVQRHHGYRR